MKNRRKQVALLVSPGWYGSAMQIRGVQDYARTHGDWTIVPIHENFSGTLGDLMDWNGDGVIANVKTRREAEQIDPLGIPVVGVSGLLPEGLLPRVLTDNEELGRMGAEHLLDCGFRRLAFVGRRGADDIAKRRAGFIEQAKASNASVSTFSVPGFSATWKTWNRTVERLKIFLSELKQPVGVMGCDPVRGRMVIDACHAAGLRVPEDVAVIAGGNSKGVCEFCDPPLSGIQRANYEMGFEGAALLDRMMNGESVPAQDVLLAPRGIARRRSTEVLAIEDPHVRTAVEHIRAHVGEAFGVDELTKRVPVSRRWLEERFREALGCSPHEHICRTRVAEAKKLLVVTPKMSFVDVAARCGFTSPKRMRIVFLRLVGASPASYREQELKTV
jgi:LacI family transcriptional regulator